MEISLTHKKELLAAVLMLENPGVTAKIINFIAIPFEKALEQLPDSWNEHIGEVTQTVLLNVAKVAVFTMEESPKAEHSNWWHKIGAATSGAVGGFFGLPALAVELPLSTTIMLRPIVDIARSEGESITDPLTILACLEVFALGGNSESDNASESGYFAIRAALAGSISDAAKFIAAKKLSEEGAPPLIRLMVNIA